MAILKRDSSAKPVVKPVFEQEPDSEVTVQEEGRVEEEVAKPAAKTTAVAPVRATPLAAAKASGRIEDVIGALKDGIVVEYNTLERIQILAGGGFVLQDSNALSLGDTIDFELQSYQDSYVISPGGKGQEGKEFVRYSSDGITTNEGEDCKDYLQQLQQDFPEAAIKKRCVLVFELQGAPNAKKGVAEDHIEKLFQMDLAPSSKTKFDSFRIQAGHAASRGRINKEQATLIRATVEGASSVNKSGEKLNWAIAKFDFQPSA